MPELVKKRESVFYCCLESEATPLGRCFVDSIWFKRPIRLVDDERLCAAQGEVWRCHITGPVFSDLLMAARAQNPARDIAAVWEIRTGDWSAIPSEEMAKWMERFVRPKKAEMPEYHLDHPCICNSDLVKT